MSKTTLKQTVADLKASNEFLTKKAEHHMMLLSGLQEQLVTATQMNAALLLKLGGSAVLTAEDYHASAGRQLQREEVGDDIRMSVAGEPAHTNH